MEKAKPSSLRIKRKTRTKDPCPVCDKNLYYNQHYSKRIGLFETDTKKEQLAVFQGFTPEQLENLNGKETKLVAAGEKESK